MASRYEIVLADDLDNTTGDVERVEFSLGADRYSLDLNKRHRADLRRAMGRYIDAAKRAERGNSPARATAAPRAASGATSGSRTPTRKNENAEIRQWARDHRVEVPKRGRIPQT